MEVKCQKNKRVNRVLVVILTFAMVLGSIVYTPVKGGIVQAASIWNGYIATSYEAGTGTKDDPYQIKWGSQLAYLSENVLKGNTYAGKYFVLTSDITLNDTAIALKPWNNWSSTTTGLNKWTAIGSYTSATECKPFAGNFNGEDHIVSGVWTCNRATNGLFGYNTGTIKNLNIEKSYIEGSGYGVGGVSGKNDGTIFKCNNGASVVSVWVDETNIEAGSVGGIAGTNGGTISQGTNNGKIDGVGVTGGVAGTNLNLIVNCSNEGTVGGNVTSQYGTGGIAGCNNKAESAVKNCYNHGSIKASNYAGGIVGVNAGGITNCFSSGNIEVSQSGGYVGAIAGTLERSIFTSSGTVAYSYWKSDMTMKIASSEVSAVTAGYSGNAGKVDELTCYKYDSGFLLYDDSNVAKDITFNIDGANETSSVLSDVLDSWTQAKNCGEKDSSYLRWSVDAKGAVFAETETDVWGGNAASSYGGGDGSEGSPYRITNGDQLKYFANQVNGGNSYNGDYFILASDICLNDETFSFDADTGLVLVTDGVNTAYFGTGKVGNSSGSNTQFDNTASTRDTCYSFDGSDYSSVASYAGTLNSWTPIGTASKPFAGIFNGKGYKISGLYIENYLYTGMFGYVDGGEINNLNISDSYYISSDTGYVGSIAGYFEGKMSRCSASALIVSSLADYVGGLAGYMADSKLNSDGSYKNCNSIFDSHFDGVMSASGRAGGIAGYTGYGGIVEECYLDAGAEVSGKGSCLGGLVGRNYGTTIVNSYSLGNVTAGSGVKYIGGIAGENASEGSSCISGFADVYGRIVNCYNRSIVKGVDGSYTGGIVGYNNGGSINNTYCDAVISGGVCASIVGVNGASEGEYTLYEGLTRQKYKNCSGTINYSYAVAEVCHVDNCDETGELKYVDNNALFSKSNYSMYTSVLNSTNVNQALNTWITGAAFGNDSVNAKYLAWTYTTGGYPKFTGTHYVESADNEPLPEYELVYDKNDINANGSMQSVTYEMTIPGTVESAIPLVSTCNYTNEGYNFKEWNTKSDGTGDSYVPGVHIAITHTTTLYAIWVSTQAVITNVNKNGKSVALTWGAVDDAAGYWVYRYKLSDASDTFESFASGDKVSEVLAPSSGTPASFTYTDDNLSEGTYYYGIRAYSILNAGSTTTATFVFKPFSSAEKVAINANTVTYNGNGANSGTLVSPGRFVNNTTASVSNNTFSYTGHSFAEWNTKSDGTGTSYNEGDTFIISNDVELYAVWEITPIDSLSVSIDDSDSSVLTWNQSLATEASGYNVYCSVGDNNHYTLLSSVEKVNGTTMKYITGKVNPGTLYYYKVTVYQASTLGSGTYSEESKYSNEISVKSDETLQLDNTKGKLEGGVYTGIDGKKVYLRWNAESGVTGYMIYRSTNVSDQGVCIGTASGYDATTYVDEVTTEGSYYYYVRSYTETNGADSVIEQVQYGQFSKALPVNIKAVIITYNSNTGSISQTRIQTTGKNFICILNDNMFSNNNFTFAGWNTSSDQSGISYGENAECIFSGDITLYAVWKLNVPINLAASLLGNTLTLTWDTNMSASGYQLYQKVDNGDYELLGNIGSVSNPSVSRVIPDVILSSSYSYYVQAYIINTLTSGDVVTSYSDKSNSITVEPSPVPQGLVTNLQYEINPDGNNGSAVKLTWTPVAGAAGYHIYRSTNSSDNGAKIADINTASYVDTSVAAASLGTYYYHVRAYIQDAGGVYYKDFSKECVVSFDSVSITYLSDVGNDAPIVQNVIKGAKGVQVADCGYVNEGYSFAEWYINKGQSELSYKTDIDKDGNNDTIDASLLSNNIVLNARWKLNPVTGVTVSLTDANKVLLSWSSSAKATGYNIYQRKGMNGSFECIGSTTDLNYTTVSEVDQTSTYYYYVAAYVDVELVSGKLKSEGLPSETVLLDANAGNIKEGQVTGLAAVINRADVTLTWDEVTGVDGYYIYRSNIENERGKCIATVRPSTEISYIDSSVTEVTKYYYSVRAFIETDSAMYYKPWSEYTSVSFEECKVKYVANNGTDTVSEVQAITGADVVITQNKFLYPGRCFVGWNTNPLGKGYDYTVGKTYRVDNDITLYAIWKLEKPSGIKAVVNSSNTAINISWNMVVGASGYLICRRAGENGPIEDRGTITETNFVDHNDGNPIDKNDVYYYFVRAYESIDSDTRRFSDYSDITAAGVIGNGAIPTMEPVGRVSNLTLLENHVNTAKIGWSGIPAADGYYIYYSVGSDGEKKFTGLHTIGSNIETLPLTLDTPYFYYVVGYIFDGNTNAYIMGDYSDGLQVMITSSPAPTATPTAPPTASPNPLGQIKNLKAEILSPQSLKLTWDEMPGITSYRIYIVDNENGNNPVMFKDVTNTELVVNDLIPGRSYYYCVSGYNTVVGSGIVFSERSIVVKALMVFATPEPTQSPVPTAGPTAGPTLSPAPATASPTVAPTEEPTKSPIVETAKPSVVPSHHPTAIPTASVSATPAPTKKPVDKTKVTNLLITDAYSDFINMIWDKVENAKGYEISYSTSLNGEKTVLATTKANDVSCSALVVTGAAFVVNEEINANGIQAYNQNINANYYFFVRAIIGDSYGTYSDSVNIELTMSNIASPTPVPSAPVYATIAPVSSTPIPVVQITVKSVALKDRVTLGKLIYEVTSTSSSGRTVSVIKPVKKTYTSMTIPATVTIEGKSYKVTAINASAFSGNKKLKSIVIGKNIKTIGKKAFYKCTKLNKITFKTKVIKSIGKNAFYNIKKKCKFVIPKSVLKKYKKIISKTK